MEDLRDFRGKITGLTWCFIEAEHRATGKDHAEIVREILHGWAEERKVVYIETQKLIKGEGI